MNNDAIAAYMNTLKYVADQCELPNTIHVALRKLGVDDLSISLSKLYVPRRVTSLEKPSKTIILRPGYSQDTLRLMLAAEHGNGKSTLLKMVAFDMIDHFDEWSICPILLQANQIKSLPNCATDITEILVESMCSLIRPDEDKKQSLQSDLLAYLSVALPEGDILLLIDDIECWPKESIKIVNSTLLDNPRIHAIVTGSSYLYCEPITGLKGFCALTPIIFEALPNIEKFRDALVNAIPQLEDTNRDFDLWFSSMYNIYATTPLDVFWAVLSSGVCVGDTDFDAYEFDLCAYLNALLRHRLACEEDTIKSLHLNVDICSFEMQRKAHIAVSNFLFEPEEKMYIYDLTEETAALFVEAGILTVEGSVVKKYYFSSTEWAWYFAAKYAVNHSKEGIDLAEQLLENKEIFPTYVLMMIGLEEYLGTLLLNIIVQRAKNGKEYADGILESVLGLCSFEAFSDSELQQTLYSLYPYK